MQIRCNFPDISYLSETQKNNFQFLNDFVTNKCGQRSKVIPEMFFLMQFRVYKKSTTKNNKNNSILLDVTICSTVNSEIFARVLFSRNFAVAKWRNHTVVY